MASPDLQEIIKSSVNELEARLNTSFQKPLDSATSDVNNSIKEEFEGMLSSGSSSFNVRLGEIKKSEFSFCPIRNLPKTGWYLFKREHSDQKGKRKTAGVYPQP
eukprot:gene11435-12632_t